MNTREQSACAVGGEALQLHLGCGHLVVEGWINVDYAVGARFARMPFFRALNRKFRWFDRDWDDRIFLHNLTKPFPWADGTVACVYSSHTLEHLSREEGLRFLQECHRVLRPGGLIRIVVPDLAFWISEYTGARLPADEFVERIGVLYGQSRHPLKTRLLPFIQFPHKCLYDETALLRVLRTTGFVVTASPPFESAIPNVRSLEIEDRTRNAVIVEGHKAEGVSRLP
jgi:predicted SAM-dependent methyltransferase